MTGMRLAALLFATVLSAQAEFRRIEVNFQPTDCVSCTESLQGRLERVRGVASVEMDLDRSVVTLVLEAGNQVRLTPLLSRITQDGTKIVRTDAVVRGMILGEGEKLRFQPAGLKQSYRLRMMGSAAGFTPRDGTVYEIRGSVGEVDAGSEPLIEAVSVEAVSAP